MIPSRDRHAVVIVGLGTLGSMLLQLLTREALGPTWAWVQSGTVFLIDFDLVLLHNLAKSAIYCPADVHQKKVAVAHAWVRGVNPDLQVIPLSQSVKDVGLGPFLDAAIAFVCADTYLAKMAASRQAWRAGVPIVMIGEMAGGASLDSRCRWFRPGPEAPCLECNWHEEYRFLERPFPCSPPDSCGIGPTTRLTVAAHTAAQMLEEAERLLRDEAHGGPAQEVRIYPGERRFINLHPRRNPTCLFDHRTLDRRAVITLGQDMTGLTLGEVFALAERRLAGVSQLTLAHEVATEFACPDGHKWPFLQRPTQDPPTCPDCGARGTPSEVAFYLTREMARQQADTPLASLSPAGDVLTFQDAAGRSLCLALPAPPSWRRRGRSAAQEGVS